MRRVALVAAVALAFGGLASQPARAATTNRAAVVVEVDGVIHTAKITFSTSSISGLDALRSAGFDPLVRVFGGNGGAVCALDIGATTIGCPADNTCLTCDAPRYWNYYRAGAGTTKYTYSIGGAGLTQVRDGDVEAWTWSPGSPPSRFVSFADVWGSAPPPTTRPPATTPPTAKPSTPEPPVTSLSRSNPTPTAPTAPRSGSATTAPSSGKKGSTTTSDAARTSSTTRGTAEDGSATTDDGAKKVATAPVVARRDAGSPYGLVGFGVLLAALVGAIIFVRRRRSGLAPGGHARS